MRNSQVKRIRSLVNQFAQNSNDIVESRKGILSKPGQRLLAPNSKKYITKMLKRLLNRTPWNLRHLVLPKLTRDSQAFLQRVQDENVLDLS